MGVRRMSKGKTSLLNDGEEEVEYVEDDQIVELFWQRNERAIQKTDEKYGSYCYTIAKQILGNHQDSEECVNDTWLRAWNGIPPQRPSILRQFLAKITRNLAFDRYKAKKTAKRGGGVLEEVWEELEECIHVGSDVEEEILGKELEESIRCFVQTLSNRESDIFVRRYFYVDSTDAIAKRYSLKESNVLMILSRTRKKLRSYLEKEGYLI